MSALLEARDVRVRYGMDDALRGASVAVGAGEQVALVGPSGSGKSTLLNCLAGIQVPDSGSVVFDGGSLSELNEPGRRRVRAHDFGFVMQFGLLIPQLTLVENVLLGGMVRGQRGPREHAQRLLDELGIGNLAERLPGEVSGGERQRAAVARALMGSPRVIFADEPTGALDSTARDSVMALLFAQARESGAALVVVTHDESLLDSFDVIHRMRDGSLVGS